MMVNIAELKWKRHPAGGEQAHVDFPNGYGASVLRGGPFYTTDGTYEIAVMRYGSVDYSTPITDDILMFLPEEEANEALAKIEALPPL